MSFLLEMIARVLALLTLDNGRAEILFLILQQTIWLFFRDMFKSMCLSLVLGPPIVSAMIVIVQVLSVISF